MLQIEGVDWACLTDRLRNSKIDLTETDRIKMCKNLANIVKILEESSISHRDLSNGNIFIDPNTFEISLIDFDSLYYSSLQMPASTTIGSEGYAAPFIDADDATLTFCKQADRFALGILIVEFLLMGKTSPFSHEGGIFNQEDINQRSGKTIAYAEQQLQSKFPGALKLFKAALNSFSFGDCPSPDDWKAFYSQAKSVFSVNDFPEISLRLPQARHATTAKMPGNPWIETHGGSKYEFNKESVNKHCLPNIDFGGDFMLKGAAKNHLPSLEFPLTPKSRKNYSLPTEPGELFCPKIEPDNFSINIFPKKVIHTDPILPLNNTPWTETQEGLKNVFNKESINNYYLHHIDPDKYSILNDAAKNNSPSFKFPQISRNYNNPPSTKFNILSDPKTEPDIFRGSLLRKNVIHTGPILPSSNRVDSNQRWVKPELLNTTNKKNTQYKPINDFEKRKEK